MKEVGSGNISIGGTGCITHCTVQNTTGHHRVGLLTEVQLKCQLRGKILRRLQCHSPGLSIQIEYRGVDMALHPLQEKSVDR